MNQKIADSSELTLPETAQRRRFRGMRVCVLQYRRNGIAHDLVSALYELGSEVRVFDVSQTRSNENHSVHIKYTVDGKTDTVPYLYREIESFDPALILLLNNQGMDGDALLYSIAELKEIPLVNWFFDDPEFFPDRLVKNDPAFVCYAVIDSDHGRRLQQRGIRNVVHIPIGADRRRYEKYANALSTHQYRVSFVGNTGQGNINQVLREITTGIGGMPESRQRALEAVINQAANRVAANPDHRAATTLDHFVASNPGFARFANHPELRCRLLSIIDLRASFSLRCEILNSVTCAPLTIIGDNYWETHLPPDATLLPTVPYNKVGAIYRNSDININVSRYQLVETVNQRIFDVPMSGGFLLTDYKPGIEALFDVDREMICYDSGQELDAKTAYYLKHPDERASIMRRGMERVMQDHSYAMRLIALLSELDTLGIRKGQVRVGKITGCHLARGMYPGFEKLLKILAKSGENEVADLIHRKLGEDKCH